MPLTKFLTLLWHAVAHTSIQQSPSLFWYGVGFSLSFTPFLELHAE